MLFFFSKMPAIETLHLKNLFDLSSTCECKAWRFHYFEIKYCKYPNRHISCRLTLKRPEFVSQLELDKQELIHTLEISVGCVKTLIKTSNSKFSNCNCNWDVPCRDQHRQKLRSQMSSDDILGWVDTKSLSKFISTKWRIKD